MGVTVSSPARLWSQSTIAIHIVEVPADIICMIAFSPEKATKAWHRQGTQQIKEHLQSLTLGVLQQECVATALHGQVENMPGPAREHKRPPEMQADQCVMAV